MIAALRVAWAWLSDRAWAAWGALVLTLAGWLYWRGREDEEDAQAEDDAVTRQWIDAELDASHAAGAEDRARVAAEHARAQAQIEDMIEDELTAPEEPGDAEASLRRAEAWRRR